jgi:hypothetical protein
MNAEQEELIESSSGKTCLLFWITDDIPQEFEKYWTVVAERL